MDAWWHNTRERCPPGPANPFAAPLASLNQWTTNLVKQIEPPKKGVEFVTAIRSRRASRERRNSKEEAPQKRRLDLKSLNPSLYVIGLETVEQILPRYLLKAGIACERMQHAGMPVEAIRMVLAALFVVPEDKGVQSEERLREVFSLFDASGDGYLDQDEFFAVLPLMGEDVPAEAIGKLFAVGDADSSGTISGAEFVTFMQQSNPIAADAAEGWRAFLPEHAAHYEEMVLLQVSQRKVKNNKGPAWRVVPPDELEAAQRSADAAWATTLLLSKNDLANAEAVIDGLRKLGFKDEEVRAVARALFVTNTDEDYASVFQIFDRDNTGGLARMVVDTDRRDGRRWADWARHEARLHPGRDG